MDSLNIENEKQKSLFSELFKTKTKAL